MLRVRVLVSVRARVGVARVVAGFLEALVPVDEEGEEEKDEDNGDGDGNGEDAGVGEVVIGGCGRRAGWVRGGRVDGENLRGWDGEEG